MHVHVHARVHVHTHISWSPIVSPESIIDSREFQIPISVLFNITFYCEY